jgi:hypothetical protein
MKVKELINYLSKINPEATIVVNGYEGGLEEPEPPRELFICPNQEKDHQGKLPWWEGEYQETYDTGAAPAVLLSRKYRFNKK